MPSDRSAINLSIDANTQKAVQNLGNFHAELSKTHSKLKETKEEANKLGEGLEEGTEHFAHHTMRALGLGGILLTGGLGGILATGGLELFSKITEGFLENIKKQQEASAEAVKQITKDVNAGGSSTGMTSRSADNIFNLAGGKLSKEDIGKRGAAMRDVDRNLSDKQIAEGLEQVDEASPNAPGADALMAELQKMGVDPKLIAELIEKSGNRPEELQKYLEQHFRTNKARNVNMTGYAAAAAGVIGSTDPRYWNREMGKFSAQDLEKQQKDSENTPAYNSPDLDLARTKKAFDAAVENGKSAPIDPEANAKMSDLLKIHQLWPKAMNNGQDMEQLVQDYSGTNWLGHKYTKEDFDRAIIKQLRDSGQLAGDDDASGGDLPGQDLLDDDSGEKREQKAADALAKILAAPAQDLHAAAKQMNNNNIQSSQQFSVDLHPNN